MRQSDCVDWQDASSGSKQGRPLHALRQQRWQRTATVWLRSYTWQLFSRPEKSNCITCVALATRVLFVLPLAAARCIQSAGGSPTKAATACSLHLPSTCRLEKLYRANYIASLYPTTSCRQVPAVETSLEAIRQRQDVTGCAAKNLETPAHHLQERHRGVRRLFNTPSKAQCARQSQTQESETARQL